MLAYPSGPPPTLAVAGLHFLLLGPVFVSFVRAPSLAAWVAACSALAMGAALVMEPTLGSHAHTIAAISGVSWALGALGAARSLARP
jgi:glucose uptake protein GlcU